MRGRPKGSGATAWPVPRCGRAKRDGERSENELVRNVARYGFPPPEVFHGNFRWMKRSEESVRDDGRTGVSQLEQLDKGPQRSCREMRLFEASSLEKGSQKNLEMMTQRGSAVSAAQLAPASPRVVPCRHLLWVTLGGRDLRDCRWHPLHGQSPAPWDRFVPSRSSSENVVPVRKTRGFWKEGIFLFL